VQFRTDEEPRLQVIFTREELALALKLTPEDSYVDVRGIALTVVRDADGRRSFEARGKARPAALRKRIVSELRRAAERQASDGVLSADVKQLLDWIAKAPQPVYAIRALGFSDPDPKNDYGNGPSGSCRSCSWIQKWYWGSPPCC